MNLTVGFDASWGGTGWCIATQDGPKEAGFIRTQGDYRMLKMVEFLHQLDLKIAGYQVQLSPASPPPVCVIERLPWAYSRMGSQVRTVYGISGCAHVIAGHYARPDWGYPWLIPPRGDKKKPTKKNPIPPPTEPGWRQWWGITGKGRHAKKRSAIRTVRRLHWGYLLDALPLKGGQDVDVNGDGPRGDVAEGILIAVGAAKHRAQAPKMPRKWPTVKL